MNDKKLIFFSGKMGVGKSTLAKKMSFELNAFYISEDEVLSDLFPGEIKNLNDYVTYSKKIKPMILRLIKNLLKTNDIIILDFPGNTIIQRQWFKEIIQSSDAFHKLIYLKASDAFCLKNIEKRRQSEPNRNKYDTEELYFKLSKFFEEPREKEGFNLEIRNLYLEGY
jgi:adenylate kinase family enzyme